VGLGESLALTKGGIENDESCLRTRMQGKR